jgi:hypothetical protein
VGAGANWWVVDESGVPFRRATESDRDLYAVTGPALAPRLGQAIETKYWSPVVQFARVMSNDTQDGESWNLRRVYFDAAGAASLRLTGGSNDETLIQLGADEWPQKLKTARWALADFASTGKHAAILNLISKTVTTWTPRAVSASEVTDSARVNEPAAGRQG